MANKLSFLFAVLFLAAAAAAILQWRSATTASDRTRALQVELDEAKAALEEARSRNSRVESSNTEAQAQKVELMRLRNEVTQLRAGSDAAARAAAENARLAAENQQLRQTGATAQAQPASEAAMPREQWAYLGSATPENALMSSFWAVREGRLDTYLYSLTPEERHRFEQSTQEQSQTDIVTRQQKELAPISGFRVLTRQQTSPSELIMDVYLEGANRVEKVRLSQHGQEWKYGGIVQPQEARDPMVFYRQNPELMKRYFPHLVQEQGQPQPAPQPQ